MCDISYAYINVGWVSQNNWKLVKVLGWFSLWIFIVFILTNNDLFENHLGYHLAQL